VVDDVAAIFAEVSGSFVDDVNATQLASTDRQVGKVHAVELVGIFLFPLALFEFLLLDKGTTTPFQRARNLVFAFSQVQQFDVQISLLFWVLD